MKTLLRTLAIALLAASVTGFAQPGDEKAEKTADNNQPNMTQKEKKQKTKKAKKVKPAKTKTDNDQEKPYDPVAASWG